MNSKVLFQLDATLKRVGGWAEKGKAPRPPPSHSEFEGSEKR